MKVNFTFTGGCFPVQHNIDNENLFHQIIKRKIEKKYNCDFNVNIIRYERFTNCLEKIVKNQEELPIDFLVFHIRMEPFLRLAKFYYKYKNEKGKLCHSVNLPFINLINPEKYDFLILGRRFLSPPILKETRLHKVFIDLNLILGILFTNYNYALKKYLKLVSEIISFSYKNQIPLIIIGPASRPHTKIENLYSKRLNNYITKSLYYDDCFYINGLGEYTSNGKSLFFENGMHANENYHELIAELLIEKLSTLIENKINFSRNYSQR